MTRENRSEDGESEEARKAQEENEGVFDRDVTRRDFIATSGKVVAGALLASTGLKQLGKGVQADNTYSFTIFNTTDVHQYLLPYNYMEDAPAENIGLAKAMTLFEEEAAERENYVLLSNGDVIQGSMLGNLEFDVEPLEEGETQRIVEIYNEMGYEAASVGNHELQDFGLDFFEHAVEGADFPWLAANMRVAGSDEHYVEPYTIIEKEVDGETVRFGIIGFVPPQTMRWGRDWLQGEVELDDIVPTAEELLPEVRKQADIVIALAHTGLDDSPVDSDAAREDAAAYLAKLDGFDAVIAGHDHNFFPGDYDWMDIEVVDNNLGLIDGLPVVMAGSWGDSLGVIDLELMKQNGQWRIGEVSVDLPKTDENVEPHPRVEELARDKHEATLEYVRTPIGTSDVAITSFFARVADNPVTQIVNDAQLWWAHNNPEFTEGEFADLPILSAAAPFQAGREDPEYFTNVRAGDVTIGSVADIYIYDNELRVMKINGEEVIEWLERSAENFNRIDPDYEGEQDLIDGSFSAFNYDVIDGIEYEIDVTQPEGERIVNATYDGEPLTADQEFLVVTNDYRAGGGGGFGPTERHDPVYAPSGLVNREIIINYIEEHSPIAPQPTNNWRIKPVEVAGTVHFRSHPEAMEVIVPGLENRVEFVEIDDEGMGVYDIDIAGL